VRPTTPSLLLAGALIAACGVPEQKYKAAVADHEKAMKEGADQRRRADLCEQKLAAESKRAADLSELLSTLDKTAAADAERKAQLAKQLEEERAAFAKRSAEYESLAASLDKQIKAGQIQLSELQGKLTVRMAEKVLFPSGSATVSTAGKQTLDTIADALKDVKGRIIRVEGHTDNVPIKTAKFPSNWELSSARAIAVVRILQADGVNPDLLGAAGYAEYQPLAPNDTAEGRAQNRRIEISLAAQQTATTGAGK
jgi:chemotaxis protein MotB